MPVPRETGFHSPNCSSRKAIGVSVASSIQKRKNRTYTEFAERTENTEKKITSQMNRGGRNREAERKAGALRLRSGQARLPHSKKGLFIDGGERFVGRAEKRVGFVENDGDGNIAEKALEFPFVLEGMKEGAFFHFLEDFDGDASGDINTAERENLQRKISSFGAIDGGP